MDYLNVYLFKILPINLLELLAAIAGSYYLKKKPNSLKFNRYFVYFLWFTFINEVIGSYAPIAYFSEYKYFGFIKDTFFYNNAWLYNIYSIISFSFFINYFNSFIKNKKNNKIFRLLTVFYIVTSLIILIISDLSFNSNSPFLSVAGTLLMLISIIYYYFSLLKIDEVLDFKKQLPVYISIGVLVFSLCITPLDIFTKYFQRVNELYVAIRVNLLLICNIFMYTTFIIGFIICAKDKPNKEKRIN